VTTKDTDKLKCNKKEARYNIATSIKELERHGLLPELNQEKQDEPLTESKVEITSVKDNESPAKRSRRSTPQSIPLTGWAPSGAMNALVWYCRGWGTPGQFASLLPLCSRTTPSWFSSRRLGKVRSA